METNLKDQSNEKEQALLREIQELRMRVRRAEGKSEDYFRFQSKTSESILSALREAAPKEQNVLFLADMGTATECLGRMIHLASRRSQGPWVMLNCAEIIDSAFESEFYGFEKGAILGANEGRAGALELARGGTLFLSGFDQLSFHRQTQLFTTIKTEQFRRLGGQVDLSLDVRIVAAAGKRLRERAQSDGVIKGSFEQIFEIPALRDRKDEVLAQALRYGELCFKALGKSFQGFESDVESFMQVYSWPGNDAELIAAIQRASLVTEEANPISLLELGFSAHLKVLTPVQGQSNASLTSFEPEGESELSFTKVKKRWSSSFEKDYLVFILKRHQGNVSAAARDARLDRSNFLRLLRKHGLKSEEFRDAESSMLEPFLKVA